MSGKKKSVLVLLAVVMIVCVAAFPAAAASVADTDVQTICFADGSYVVIGPAVTSSARAVRTTSGSKTATGYSSTGSALWTFTIHGMFIYDGTMAKATNASYSYQIYDDEWSFKSGNAYCSGSQTIGEATFKGTLFVSQNVPVTLTWSPDGKLS